MCSLDPVTIGLSMQAGQFILGQISGQQKYKADVKAANVNYANETAALSEKSSEVNAQYSEDVASRAIEAAKSQGRIAASISEGGFGKNAAFAATQSEASTRGRESSLAEKNLKLEQLQIKREGQGASIRQINQMGTKPLNPLAAMGIVGASMAALSQGGPK